MQVTVVIDGRLDTDSSVQLDEFMKTAIAPGLTFTVDCAKMSYITSAGLRVLLQSYKKLANQGGLTVVNANSEVKNVFSLCGFDNILTIK